MSYFSTGESMEEQDVDALFEGLGAIGKVDRLAFIIETPGGDPDAAHLMSRALHAHTKHLDVLVLSRAASAGTLFAIGADTLWMGASSLLGPIDPQVPVDRRLIIPSARPGDDWPGYMHFPAHAVRDFLEFAGVVAPETREERRPVVDLDRLDKVMSFQLNPMLIGNYERADKVSKVYARQALSEHLLRGVTNDDLRARRAERIIHALLDRYASHSAGILRNDARALDIPVEDTPPDVWDAMRALREFYLRAMQNQKLARIMETTTWADAGEDRDYILCNACKETVSIMPYCSNCGTEIFRHCPECQYPARDDWKFCGMCGKPLPPTPSTTPAVAPAPTTTTKK
jgi:hypothetical protein